MPPKQKKQPKNAYFFYMQRRKQELEQEGYRFPRGYQDVAQAVCEEWKRLSPEDKEPFEEMSRIAKSESKFDLTNKFTVTGESYAQVQTRVHEDRQLAEEMDDYIDELGTGDGTLDRIFILMKTAFCVEQIVLKNERVYWPSEIGMAAFSLREGLKSTYWTLVDTVRTPVGYASAAKEASEETGLPEPGSDVFTPENRDYNNIMKNVKGFIEHWLKKGYRKGPVIFAVEKETTYIQGCLEWLIQNMDQEKQVEYTVFLKSIKFYKLPKLIVRIAQYANQLNPNYENVITTYKLEQAALAILSKGCYDWKDQISCRHHIGIAASLKMSTCSRNIVLRRMFLMFDEFLPAFDLQKLDRHDINKLPKPSAPRPRAPSSTKEEDVLVRPSSSQSSSTESSRPEKTDQLRSSSNGRRREEVVSDSNSESACGSGKRKHEEEPCFSDSHPDGPSRKSLIREDTVPSSQYDPRPSSPSLMSGNMPEYGVPWGATRKPTGTNFNSEDFPALGSSIPARSARGGMGRGALLPNDDEDDNNDVPVGRGQGAGAPRPRNPSDYY